MNFVMIAARCLASGPSKIQHATQKAIELNLDVK